MKIVISALRVMYGAIFFIFGLNGFLSLIPVPPMGDEANHFWQALLQTGYMVPMWKAVEMITGFAIIFNLFKPLALIVLSPVLINIFFFHLYLDQEHLFLPIALIICHCFFLYQKRSSYTDLLKV